MQVSIFETQPFGIIKKLSFFTRNIRIKMMLSTKRIVVFGMTLCAIALSSVEAQETGASVERLLKNAKSTKTDSPAETKSAKSTKSPKGTKSPKSTKSPRPRILHSCTSKLPSESNSLFDVTPFESLIHQVFRNHNDVVNLVQQH
jgi:hypothetical protein